ncbi:MAG: hypothetical protein KAZ26_24435, partial [Caldilineaceae bacterium]|nr:hypothetical protein [Caldilineaceae bacterium]
MDTAQRATVARHSPFAIRHLPFARFDYILWLFLLVVPALLTGCGSASAPVTVPVTLPAPTPTTVPTLAPSPTPQPAGPEVTIWAPLFSVLEQNTVTENADLIGEINFFWYELARDGSIKGAVQSQYGMDLARSAGVRIVPSILNGGFDRARVAEIIHDPARRAQHIKAILALVMENNFDGIDIDYESLYPEDRDNFSLFIEELAAALHAEDKLLSMAVHAKTEEPGNWGGPQAQDWVRLGAAVDEFKIMVYDYHNGASEAGPIAPLAWADDVLTFAATQLPPQKTYLGVPVYGYRWTGSRGESLIWRQVNKLIEQSAPILQRDENGEAWFTLDTGQTVYYHDAESMRVRLQTLLTAHPDLAGISIWSLGGEDPAIWPTIRQ